MSAPAQKPIPLRESICPWCFRKWQITMDILLEDTIMLKCSQCGTEVIIIRRTTNAGKPTRD
jgi:hypothetical protein